MTATNSTATITDATDEPTADATDEPTADATDEPTAPTAEVTTVQPDTMTRKYRGVGLRIIRTKPTSKSLARGIVATAKAAEFFSIDAKSGKESPYASKSIPLPKGGFKVDLSTSTVSLSGSRAGAPIKVGLSQEEIDALLA